MPGELEKIKSYFAGQEDVAAVYLFGSAARGTLRPHSDYDLALIFAAYAGDGAARFDRLLLFGVELQSLLRRPVDVIDLSLVPLPLRHQIFKEGILLVEKDRERRISFEVSTRRQYFDLKPLLAARTRALLDYLKEVR
ncbi:MAG: nucleotidyltransferase domain-containing protein [Thermoanaerobacteraceae bacterium]|nr:nucleotidyltransferase domain-containing protein [Thermoanaerobacteraceae bacterium]